MSLSHDDAREAYAFLITTLRERRLEWVVTQVEEKIAVGKIQSKKLTARDYVEPEGDFWPHAKPVVAVTRKSEVFAVAEEYNTLERLNILLDAMVLAVVRTNEVVEATFGNLHQFGVDDQLQFEPEADVVTPFILVVDEEEDRIEATSLLLDLIEELRRGGTNADTPQPAN